MNKQLFCSFKCLTLLLLLLCNIPYAMSQKPSNDRVTLHLENVTAETFFQTIEKQTKYTFLYRKDLIDGTKRITVVCDSKPLSDVLNEHLPALNLTYKTKDYTIILAPVAYKSKGNKVQISGKVFDEQKMPIIGASVKIKGTTSGVTTDLDGHFTINASLDDRVIISYIGLETLERKIGERNLTIVMKDDAVSLGDVVVTGYQKINRKLFTGSAAKVNAEETILKGTPDLTTSLQGKVSGVQIANVSGTFGASPVLTIRGNSSINGTNKPLWVVDGVVLEDLTTVSAQDLTSGNLSTLLSSGVAGINPEDISSFEILKDVSATSLYGAQAMNGVIVITTKQGKKDRLNVNYTGSFAVKQKPSYESFNIMNSADEMSLYNELHRKGLIDITTMARSENYGVLGKMYNEIAKKNINWGPNRSLNQDFLSVYANSNTDWFDLLFHNSLVNQHSLSISGGGDKTTYYASLSYYNDNGMAIESDNVKRYTASLRGSFDITKNFKLGVKLSANIRDQRVAGTKDRRFDTASGEFVRDFDINPFNYALNTSRSMRAYDTNGNLEYFRRSYADFNILHELRNNFVDVTVKDISTQLDLEYNPLKTLSLKASFQYRAANTLREHKINETSNQAQAYRATSSQAIIDANNFLFADPTRPTLNPYSVLPEGGFYNTHNSDLRHTYFRTTADYSPKLGIDHTMNIFAGFECNIVNRYINADDGWGYLWNKGGVVATHPDVMKYLSNQGESYFAYGQGYDRRISSFINAAYSFQGKYVFNAGFRNDGSNQLGASKDARYLPSWNVSGAWNIHEEPFMKNVRNIITTLKPKVSYGYNGIMGPSSSAELTIYADQVLRPTDKEVINQIGSLQNENLTWEKMYELNLGLEAGLFNNKVMLDFTHYRRKSIDLIDRVTTSGIGGESIKFGNIGNMESHGCEFAITTVNFATKNFDWKTTLNFNFHKSEITKLNNYSKISTSVSNTGTALLGYPQRGLFSVRFAGLDKEGIPTFYGENNKIVYDMNLQSSKDIACVLKYEGPLEPKSYGGMTNTFRYKDWNLSFGFVYRAGSVIRLDDQFHANYDDYSAFPKELKNRWMMPGDEKITNVPAILNGRTNTTIAGKQTYQMYNKSTERVAKGDFIRLKDLTIGYRIPKSVLGKSGISNANVSFQATNLWLIYSDKKLSGIDPEFFLSGGVSSPVSRMYTMTLNLTF